MERRFVLFLVLSFAILLGYSCADAAVATRPSPRRQPLPARTARQARRKSRREAEKPAAKNAASKAGRQAGREAEEARRREQGQAEPQPEPEVPEQWVTLGSADRRNDPYRMLVTLTNKGAALARIELSSPRYCDIDDR